MTYPALVISKVIQRRFILGKQGLYPGRRLCGKTGVGQAIQEDHTIQIDPLNVVARSHDIALYGRVLDYHPGLLEELLYTDRKGFDYGGTVMVHSMQELPYWRVHMERKKHAPYWIEFAASHAAAIDIVRKAITEKGPLGTRDIDGNKDQPGSYRSAKDTGRALYYLWLTGELMTHSRRRFDRIYDLSERIAPPDLIYIAPITEAEEYFALKVFRQNGITTLKKWRNHFSDLIERPVDQAEAERWIGNLLAAEKIIPVCLEGSKELAYVLAEDRPDIETLQRGEIPETWEPLDSSTGSEVTFLAPLEVVSARGRSSLLFDFEYLWEVYKPQSQRRWGYYTLPILYGDRLVARLDPKLHRAAKTLCINGFWLEDSITFDEPFIAALAKGLNRFMCFTGAEQLEMACEVPAVIMGALKDNLKMVG